MTAENRVKETIEIMSRTHAQVLCVAMDGTITPVPLTREDLTAFQTMLNVQSVRARSYRGVPRNQRMGF